MGMERFDTVNIWGFNSPEWVMAVMAAMFAGGKVAGIYPTDTPLVAAYKVVHSGGCVAVVEDKATFGVASATLIPVLRRK